MTAKAWQIEKATDPAIADDFVNFADAAIRSGDFLKALDAADISIRFGPELISPEINRAHALMFLDRLDEARTLYVSHIGTELPDRRPQRWEEAIEEDFRAYRAMGRQHPLMDEVEKLFPPPKPTP